jgi:hypothetical protein
LRLQSRQACHIHPEHLGTCVGDHEGLWGSPTNEASPPEDPRICVEILCSTMELGTPYELIVKIWSTKRPKRTMSASDTG